MLLLKDKMKKILFALVAMLGIVACETQPPMDPAQTLLISADKLSIVADGVDTTTFTVTDKNKNEVNATILFADTQEALEGNTFKTKYAGEYVFYAKYGNEISNTISITTTEVGDNPTPAGELYLSVDKATIDADGIAVATFSTTIDGEAVEAVIYNAADDSALEGNTFSTETVGVYTFYAKYEELTSNEVQVTAKMKIVEEEKPIVIEASTDTIKANGVDFATFTVIQDGANVTTKVSIYVNGGLLNGNKFVTTTPGTYTIYATKGELKSNEITITAEEVTSSGTSIVLADGVTLTSGWYDVEKTFDGSDAMMCWAAASSNILQWWQDHYKAAGNTLPAGCPDGKGSRYALAIMDSFYDNWNNVRGGWVDYGVIWYFEGRDIYSTMDKSYRAWPYEGTGGYYAADWNNILNSMYTSTEYLNKYTNEVLSYKWRNEPDVLLAFSNCVVKYIETGMIGFSVGTGADLSGGHSITLWGYEIDNATGYITALYITDSDDKTTALQRFTIETISNGTAKLKITGPNFTYYPMGLYPVSGYGTANE